MQIIDGKAISGEILKECEAKVKTLKAGGISVSLAVILAGDDPASQVYVRNKERACEQCGIRSIRKVYPAEVKEEELLQEIERLNRDPSVNGILVQLPLPPQIDPDRVLLSIDPIKDVDGFHPMNVGRAWTGGESLVSCTPAGIIELLKRSGVSIDGKECVVLGRSNIVGKPMAELLLRENGTVTVCHSHTKDLQKIASRADILVAAIGKPKFITAEYVKEGACVIDVGIHRMENGKLCGDVCFDEVKDKCSYITPVPGGVGPMTIAMLMDNCIRAAIRQKQ